MDSGIGEGRKGLRTYKEGRFSFALCFAGVGTSLPDIPRPILHSDVTELSGIYPAGLRTLLTVTRLMILFLSTFLTVQVTDNFLLMSSMPGVKSNKQSQQQGARTCWMRDTAQTVV